MSYTRLTGKQRKFTKALIKGNTIKDSVKLAGYDVKNDQVASSIGNRLVKKELIIQALDDAGLSDKALGISLKTSIQSGLGIKATNSDAISGIRLAYELKGALQKDTPDSLNQTNVYINELKAMDNTELIKRLNELTKDTKQLQS